MEELSTGLNKHTLYIKNINDKIKKDELKRSLYMLFSVCGSIVKVVTVKGPKMKGQAHIIFTSEASATIAMATLQGTLFYDKKLIIDYARKPSMVIRDTRDGKRKRPLDDFIDPPATRLRMR
ncbi:hypothetical protein CANCADRAFT_105128 [Tortispora caseinolytica NRRL Y-17796]|uniref:RRM domain-containing protein n=1 Tax=Tortispora caseinolytica NRRL Y-17796 TaxID=767744 RepID=A0A1E4TF78_9ASCO|nr:hypothetical protein CANCADRAFT_105128 [Tortispora caseinolytica NRRL Y-17796]